MIWSIACAPSPELAAEDRAEAAPAAARHADWGLPDEAAQCAYVAVLEAYEVELGWEAAFDEFVALGGWSAALALPSACAGRVEIWTETPVAWDLTVCARIAAGEGEGRNFCWDGADLVRERDLPARSAPAESLPEAELSFDAAADWYAGAWGDAETLPTIEIGAVDGRLAELHGRRALRDCVAEQMLALLRAEWSYDAGFDAWSDEAASLVREDSSVHGARCAAWLASRSSLTAAGFDLEVRVIEGPEQGASWGASESTSPAWLGRFAAERGALADEGWVLGPAWPE